MKPQILYAVLIALLPAATSPSQALAPPRAAAGPVDFSLPADWMSRNAPLLGGRKLANVVLPGSHDAASYSLRPDSSVCPARIAQLSALGELAALGAFFMAPRARAQEESIGSQLAAGVRYLDLRVCALREGEEPPQFFLHHTFLGAPLDEVLAELDAFTRAHPREIVILDFQHLSGFTAADRRWLARHLEAQLGDRMLARSVALGAVTVGELWTRRTSLIVLLEDAPRSPHIYDRRDNLESRWMNAGSVSGLLSAMATRAKEQTSGLHVLQWQITPGLREFLAHPFSTLKDFAAGPNHLIHDGTLRGLLPPASMNVVMTDDATSVAASIAQLNALR